MRGYRFPVCESEQQTVISRFGGMDCRTHPTKASLGRSPDMQNMICDQNDFLVKRTGWHTQFRYDAPIYGLFAMPDGSGCAVHAGKKLFFRASDGSQTELCADMNEAFSQSFTMNGTLYLLDGKTYRAVRRNSDKTAWEAVPVCELAYVPTTTISAAPNGGGTSYEAVNLLTPKRINTFIGDGSSTKFRLDTQRLDIAAVTAEVGGSPVTVAGIDYTGGVVTLASAPPNGNGLANVSILFSKTVSGSADKINKCRFSGSYGGKNDTRVFLSGNPDEPNCDWQSGLYDPAYFPDTGYARMGTDASAILGYLKQYESQIVVKSGDAQESTSYLRTYMMADDGTALYPLKQGAHGAGAVSSRCFASLNDMPLFLSARGVQGIFGTAVAEQRTIHSVSDAIVPRLEKESDLQNACAVVYEGRYHLAVGGHMYVADGTLSEENGDPAWFFWANVPAQCLAVLNGRLWFGTADGRLCRFAKADEPNAYCDDAAAINAYWRTPTLPLSDWSRFKSICDVIPTLMPYACSGVSVWYETDSGSQLVFSRSIALPDTPAAVSLRTRRRQHRTPLFAVRIGNDRPNEPFGLLALTIRWTQGQTVI